MSSSTDEPKAQATEVVVNKQEFAVHLRDGRTITVPLAWYPRLSHGTLKERRNWRLIGQGEGIHWPDLDEDIRVGSLLQGKLSGESQASLKRWLESRPQRKTGKKPAHKQDRRNGRAMG
jgi:Protein of unknown function (DUF2442)